MATMPLHTTILIMKTFLRQVATQLFMRLAAAASDPAAHYR